MTKMSIKKFLFEHQNTKQIIAKNTFWLGFSGIIPPLLKFFLVLFIARILGAEDYGKFSFALAFASLFVLFTDFGVGGIVTREFSKDSTQERYFPAILALKIGLSLLVLVATILVSLVVTSDPAVRWAIWILTFYILFQALKSLADAFFHARQHMEYEAITTIFGTAILTLFGFFVLFTAPSIRNISLSYAGASLFALALAFALLHFRIAPLAFSFAPKIWKQFILLSWPIGLAGMSGMVMIRIDSLVLGLFGQMTQNGWYSVAYGIWGVIILPMNIVVPAFFPAMNRAFHSSLEKFQRIYDAESEIAIFLAFGFLAGGMALAPEVIDFLYKPAFAPANLSLQILSAAAVFYFLAYPLQQALFIGNLQKKIFLAAFAGAAVNVILDIALVPSFSLYGTAFATFASQAVIWIILFRDAVLRIPAAMFGAPLRIALAGGILSGAIMYVSVTAPALRDFPVLILILLGGGVYSAAFWAFRFLAVKLFPNDYKYATQK